MVVDREIDPQIFLLLHGFIAILGCDLLKEGLLMSRAEGREFSSILGGFFGQMIESYALYRSQVAGPAR
jgi:hypothetical protein